MSVGDKQAGKAGTPAWTEGVPVAAAVRSRLRSRTGLEAEPDEDRRTP
ncbi:hypothetical protein [Natronobacterium haloterrestre]|nr:hypothetical protein [Halobiforma haloterrestris]